MNWMYGPRYRKRITNMGMSGKCERQVKSQLSGNDSFDTNGNTQHWDSYGYYSETVEMSDEKDDDIFLMVSYSPLPDNSVVSKSVTLAEAEYNLKGGNDIESSQIIESLSASSSASSSQDRYVSSFTPVLAPLIEQNENVPPLRIKSINAHDDDIELHSNTKRMKMLHVNSMVRSYPLANPIKTNPSQFGESHFEYNDTNSLPLTEFNHPQHMSFDNNQIYNEEKYENQLPPLSSPIGSAKDLRMACTMYPQIGKPAPIFAGTAVVNGQFKDISLKDYKGQWVVLFFYPLDFTFVCPTEIIAYSDRSDDFRKIGCEIIACSADSHFSHLAWINTPRKAGGLGSMKIPLLSDKTGKICHDYGVYIEESGIPFRGLFIIDDKQNLRQITINDLPVGRSVDETMRLVQAYQFTDKHGEVCPVNWKPGDDTMKPNVDGSKTYFEKHE